MCLKEVTTLGYNFDEMINRIKNKKKEARLTNKQLSELADVPYGTLNKILGSETREPSINTIIKISTALGVSTEYILNGEEKSSNNIKNKKSPPPENKWEALEEHLNTLSDTEIIELEEYVEFLLWKRLQKMQDQQG